MKPTNSHKQHMTFHCDNCGKAIDTKEDAAAHFDYSLCAKCGKEFEASMEEAEGSARYSVEEMILAEAL